MSQSFIGPTPDRRALDRLALRAENERRPLGAVDLILPLGVAAVLRIALAVAFMGTAPMGDEASYLRLGGAWQEHGTYTGSWAPGYPWLIGTVQGMAGEQAANAMRLIQVILAIWTGAYLARVAAMFGGRRAGVVAAWAYALYLPLAAFSAMIYSESLFLAALVPASYHLLRFAREGRLAAPWWRPILAGGFLGLAALTRESTVLFLFPAVLWTAFALRGHPAEKRAGGRSFRLWAHGSGPLGLAPAAIVLLSFLCVIAPWTARNAHMFNRLVPVGVTAGANAKSGWNAPDINFDLAGLPVAADQSSPLAGQLRARLRGEAPAPWHGRTAANRADQVRYNVIDGAHFIADHPGFFLRTRLVEFADLVSPLSFVVRQLRLVDGVGEPFSSGASRWWLGLLTILSWPLLVFLALWGWATARDAHPLRTFATMTVLCTSSVIFISGFSRLRIPMVPLLIVLAAIALSGSRERPSVQRRAVASLAAVVVVLAWLPSLGPAGLSLSELW